MLAKTVKTGITTVTKGEYKGQDLRLGDPSKFESPNYFYEYAYAAMSGWDCYNYYSKTITVIETQTEVPDDVVTSDKTVPDKDPEAEAKEKKKERYRKEAEQLREEALRKQREEEALIVQKAAEKLNTDFTEQINSAIEQALNNAAAGQGAVAVIRTDYFTCFTQGMLDILKAHPEVSYEIHYLYQGKHYVLTIPAGADLSSLESSEGYYGFRYLDSVFGGYEEE